MEPLEQAEKAASKLTVRDYYDCGKKAKSRERSIELQRVGQVLSKRTLIAGDDASSRNGARPVSRGAQMVSDIRDLGEQEVPFWLSSRCYGPAKLHEHENNPSHDCSRVTVTAARGVSLIKVLTLAKQSWIDTLAGLRPWSPCPVAGAPQEVQEVTIFTQRIHRVRSDVKS